MTYSGRADNAMPVGVSIRRMSDSSAPEPTSHNRPTKAGRDRDSWITAVIAALAIVALGLSLWTLLHPAPGGSESAAKYSDAQRAEAKTQACTAFTTVRTGVKRNTSMAPPGGPDDVTGTLAVAANARLALYIGGQYLLDRVGPATPQQLADVVRGFANNLMDIGAAATAGTLNSDPQQAARLKNADAENTKIEGLCG
jgi:hypothetical protein